MKNLTITIFLLICAITANSQHKDIKTDIFNIKDFGAVGDSITLETKAIQDAIDACHKKGGGTVWIPSGKFLIGTIRLKSHVTLSLDYGAYLLGSTNIADYDTTVTLAREGNRECLLFAKNAKNITIEGLGVIDARGSYLNFPRDRTTKNRRPRLMRLENCTKLKFAGVTYKNPAFWGIHLIDCKDIHFNAVTVRFRNNNYNNDGLDLDGCEDVLIENCDINAGDDAICLKSSLNPCKNIDVRNCKVSSNTAALKFGSSSFGGFINVKVSNCYFYDCPMGAIKLQLVDGGRMENVDISRIVIEDSGSPIFIRLGNRAHVFAKDLEGKNEEIPVGSIKNIRISDVVVEVTYETPKEEAQALYKRKDLTRQNITSEKLAEKQKSRSGPIMITGIPGHYVEDVTLENITISYPGGGTEDDAKLIVNEDEKRYPEQYFFGVLPAWGAYIRHAKNIQFKNVNMTTRNPDAREMIVLDDVEGFINE